MASFSTLYIYVLICIFDEKFLSLWFQMILLSDKIYNLDGTHSISINKLHPKVQIPLRKIENARIHEPFTHSGCT